MIKGVFARRTGQLTLLARTMSVVAVLLILGLGILSVSPELHALVHPDFAEHHDDANGGEHSCMITHFAAGEAWFDHPILKVEPVALPLEAVAAQKADHRLALVAHRLLPICGPPTRSRA